MLDGDDVVFIARGSPARMFSAGLDIGYRLPAFCTSVGRAMLGQFDDAELAEALDGDAPRAADAAHGDRSEAAARRRSSPIASRAIRWSIARPSRVSARSRCRSAATTAPSSPPSTWARMSIACRPREMIDRFLPLLRERRASRCDKASCCDVSTRTHALAEFASRMSISFNQVIPILRIFDIAKADEF